MTIEELQQLLLQQYRREKEEKSKEAGVDTVKAPIEQAVEKQKKRAKDRHKNLLKDYNL